MRADFLLSTVQRAYQIVRKKPLASHSNDILVVATLVVAALGWHSKGLVLVQPVIVESLKIGSSENRRLFDKSLFIHISSTTVDLI